MASNGDWDGNEGNYLAAVEKMMEGFKTGSDFVKEIHDLIGIAKMTMKGENKTRPISLDDVIKLKAACDLYLIMKARIEMKKAVDELRAKQSAPEGASLGEAETEKT